MSIIDSITQAIQSLLGQKNPSATNQNTLNQAVQQIQQPSVLDDPNEINWIKNMTPQQLNAIHQTPATPNIVPQATQQSTPIQQAQQVMSNPPAGSSSLDQATLDKIQQNMTNGFIKLYGKNSPALGYIPQIMQKVQTDPFYQNNPYLPAAQLVMESSGGSNITRPNNPTNWGIAVPGNNEAFAKMSPQQVFDRYLTGIEGRDPNYAQFNTGKPLTQQEINALGQKYVGPDDKTYGQRIYSQIQAFQNQ